MISGQQMTGSWQSEPLRSGRGLLENPVLRPLWEDLACALAARRTRPTDSLADLEIIHGLRLLHVRMLHAEACYRQAVERSRNGPTPAGSGWSWQPLVENDEVRLGVLTVYRARPVPLHDHPGADVLSLVVSGSVRVRVCSEPEGNTDGSPARLRLESDRQMEAGEVVAAGHARGNIHGFEALDDRATLLDVIVPPYKESLRHWYFPFKECVSPGRMFTADRACCTDASTRRLRGG